MLSIFNHLLILAESLARTWDPGNGEFNKAGKVKEILRVMVMRNLGIIALQASTNRPDGLVKIGL